MKLTTLPLVTLCTLLCSCSPTFALAKEVKIADSLKLADSVSGNVGSSLTQRTGNPSDLSSARGDNAVLPQGAKTAAESSKIRVDTLLGTPYVLAGRPNTAYLKIGLEGFDLEDRQRAPVNFAIVLDKSSSMAGEKMDEAKRAAVMAVNAMSPSDTVSVITYDSTVSVIVPATEVIDKDRIAMAIGRVEASGSTALFAGVSRGAGELRKYLSENRVNRIVLLSDGMANIGPSSPGELASLGMSLAREGMSVTTIGLGLGYNEDLMLKLAMASDGNHAFVEDARELAKIFEYELGIALSVVAQNVDAAIELEPGIVPVRVLGRDAVIDGQTVRTRFNQVLGGHHKYILIEVALPPMRTASIQPVGKVVVSYNDLSNFARKDLVRNVSVTTTTSARVVEEHTNTQVMVAAVEMLANERNKVALELRDQGKYQQAMQVVQDNQSFLRKQNEQYRSKRLDRIIDFNEETVSPSLAKENPPAQWNRARKQMREEQFEIDMQQSLH